VGVAPASAPGGIALAGDRVRVQGALQPAVAGQVVTIELRHAGHRLRRLTVRPRAGDGAFSAVLRARESGHLAVVATHAATPQQAAAAAAPARFVALRPSLSPGDGGPSARFLQRTLAARHYAVPRSGRFDAATARAVVAFRKVTRMSRSSVADRSVFRALLRGRGAFPLRFPRDGRHLEADLGRQVLALADGGRVLRIYPLSSGKPSTPTVLGRFRVYSKTPGTNAKGMVYSSYFVGGYAVHGYFDVPLFAASHGCLRVPIPDAVTIYNWLRLGTRVDVYRR
jgi:lipoprotein-anchoring transpeptidase ErfK/SrfK